MYYRLTVIAFIVLPLLLSGQSIVMDIEYQPNTTYQWTQSLHVDGTMEYIGAEDFGDWFDQMGIDPYREFDRSEVLQFSMTTDEWTENRLSYTGHIDAFEKEFSSSDVNPSLPGRKDSLETSDIIIKGRVNHYQRIEIDSISGVDSLHEKNSVFKLLDDVHRNLKFPKEKLSIGGELKKTTSFRGDSTIQMVTLYRLVSIEDEVASISLEYSIASIANTGLEEIFDDKGTEGFGEGRILYDIKSKQVILSEYSRSVKTFNRIMDMVVESDAKSTYRWTLNISDS